MCDHAEKAAAKEFPLYDNASVEPFGYSGHIGGCFYNFSSEDPPEQILTYFAEQLELHNWHGVPIFGHAWPVLAAYRGEFTYSVAINGHWSDYATSTPSSDQQVPSGLNQIEVHVAWWPPVQLERHYAKTDYPTATLSEEELERFTGEYMITEVCDIELLRREGEKEITEETCDESTPLINGEAAAVVRLVGGRLELRKPGRLPNYLIPVPPVKDDLVQFRIEHFDYEDDWGVQFRLLNDKVTAMTIFQADSTGLHRHPGLFPNRVELVPIQQ